VDTGAAEVIKLAVMAVGGQGGGVLANWIVDLAERGGYAAQMTSVAGVAQRTGATIYYIEMAPRGSHQPVFALAPSPADVDILIASELMEAGRAVMRGFVTPDRTTLIASTHRILAVSEKEIPGDGRGDGIGVLERVQAAALKAECFDMDAIAAQEGSFISASLFGGLARSRALPFAPELFEDVIGASARGAARSLAAFRAARDFVETINEVEAPAEQGVSGPNRLIAGWEALLARLDEFPSSARPMLKAGLQKTVDYQDLAYGGEYLDHVARAGRGDASLTEVAAKYIANAMCYDDILRVADLKTRASREVRLRREQQAGEHIVQVTEYLHPRGPEILSIMPARLGAWIEARPGLAAWIDRRVNRGRRIKTDRISGFGMLWLVAALRPWRRSLLRHRVETAHLKTLMAHADAAPPSVAAEILTCQRLIKGYSDTHARGHSKFALVMQGADLVAGRIDAADWIQRLREAALSEEGTGAVEGALETVKSFTEAA
ncbi:MAG: indolepyruvate oxidoreductase subunit beta family protein, partial [Pseudomonadota bacterium]